MVCRSRLPPVSRQSSIFDAVCIAKVTCLECEVHIVCPCCDTIFVRRIPSHYNRNKFIKKTRQFYSGFKGLTALVPLMF